MKLAAAILLLTACSSAPMTAEVTSEPEQQTHTEASGELMPGDLCYSIDPRLLAYYPDAANTLASAGAEWGLELVTDDRCPNKLDLLWVDDEPGEHPYGRTDGRNIYVVENWLSEDPTSTDGTVILDISRDECMTDYGGARVILRSVLVHELGHVLLGSGHSGKRTGAMVDWLGDCQWLEPSAEELERVRW